MSEKSSLPLIGALLFGAAVLGGAVLLQSREASDGPSESLAQLESAGRTSLEEGQQLIAYLSSEGRPKAAEAVSRGCESDWDACSCLQSLAEARLDAGLIEEIEGLFARDLACQEEVRSKAIFSEVLARQGESSRAESLALEVSRLNEKDPHAPFALAYLSRQKKEYAEMLGHIRAAIQRGRGPSAHLFAFQFFLEQGQLKLARKELETVLEFDPLDVDGLYNLAILDQTEGRYLEAREGYLHVARIAPRHADTRFNLGVLTHSVGALAESNHNLQKLTKLVGPNDSRVTVLTELINGPPAPLSNRFVFKKGEGTPAETPSASQSSPVQNDKPATLSADGR